MSETVVPMFGVHTADALPSPPDPRTIANIESILEAAKAGRARAIAFVLVDEQSRAVRTWFCGESSDLVGATARLHYRVMRQVIPEGDDDFDNEGGAA